MKIAKKIINKFYPAPARFAGGPILNLLGYHVLRTIFLNAIFALSKKRYSNNEKSNLILNELIKTGIVVIPNFFPEEVFKKIKAECDGLDIKVYNERTPHIKRDTFVRDRIPSIVPTVEKYLSKNPYINNVVGAALRKDILIYPKVQIEKTSYHEEDLGKQTTDVRSDNLHFDVSYPTYKTFLYLTDTDEDNAAYNFVPGSSKMTLARLWMEYKMSLMFYWKWDEKRRCTETPKVSSEFVKGQGLNIKSMVGKSNTLVITNTMGYHRRGTFSSTKLRYVIISSYRELESLKYWGRKYHKNIG